MNNPQQIAELIRMQTTLQKISIRQMLKEIGLGVNSLSHMDNGSMPKADNLGKVADYLNVSTDYLLGRTENPHTVTQINTGDVGDNSSVNINNRNEDEELLSMIKSLNLIQRSKVVLFIDELKK